MTVELYDSQRDYSQSKGNLVYKGGPLLNKCKLYGVYFFSGNNSFPFAAEMSKFLDWYGTSSLVTELSEYKILGPTSHPADFILSLSGSTPVPVPVPVPVPTPPPVPVPNPGPPPPVPHHRCPPGCRSVHHRTVPDIIRQLRIKQGLAQVRAVGTTVTDGDLQKLFTDAIAAGNLPKPDPSTLFVSFLPSGVVVDLGSDASCQSFCGYHSSYQLPDSMNVFYCVLPYPSCDGCLGGLSALDALTSTTSHEISEALTDPIPGLSWYDDAGGEVGDICAWQSRRDGPYTVQLEWSNSQGKCI